MHRRGRFAPSNGGAAAAAPAAKGSSPCGLPLFSSTCEAEVGVRLLPLETLNERKLSSRKVAQSKAKAGLPKLGSVLLRLRLHLFETTLPKMLVQDFVREPKAVVLAQNAIVRLDDPKSVMNAASTAMSRLHAAMNIDVYLRSWHELRHHDRSQFGLAALWTFAVFLASSWHLPGCVVLLWAAVLWQVSQLSAASLAAAPPAFFEEEEEKLGLHVRSKQTIRNVVEMELKLVRFARQLTIWAAFLEKVIFICSLRDPYISAAYGLVIVVFGAVIALLLWVLWLMPFGLGPPIFVWSIGIVALLRNEHQESVRQCLLALKAAKERRFGPSKLKPALKNLWLRVPDTIEAKHWDLFESSVLLPMPDP